MIHIDVMDGRFVPNITMGPLVVEAVRRVTDLPLDVHLMIVEPEAHLQAFASAGADRISVHYEACPHLHRTLQVIHQLGCQAGVALNPHTPASVIRGVLDLLDFVMVMTVNPGFSGQTFIESTLSKIATLRAMTATARQRIEIAVDGGINAQTAMSAAQAGAQMLVAGSSVFNNTASVQANMDALRAALNVFS